MDDAEHKDDRKTPASVSVSPSEASPLHGSPISQYAENLAALRDFVELIEPVLDGRRESVMRERANHLAPLMCMMHEVDPEAFPEAPSAEAMSKAYGSDITVEISRDDDKPSSVGLRVHGNSVPFRHAVQELMRTGQHVTLLYRNTLISLVSYVEWFVSRLLHEHYSLHPGAWESDRCLSLKELADVGSVEEAKRYIIDQKVEEILRASLEDWVKHFRSHLGLSMGYLDKHMDALVELFQRRNLTVHHGGVVNSTYLTRVTSGLTKGLALGQALPVSRDYVMSSIDVCDLCFTLVGMENWKKCDPEDGARAEMLSGLNFNHMTSERWPVSEGLSFFLSKDAALPERDRLIGQVNYWQSLKWQNRTSELGECLKGADFDAKEPVFRYCLMALRDDLDGLVAALPSAVARGDLQVDWLEEWPIFRNLRLHRGCAAFLAEQAAPDTEPNDAGPGLGEA